MKQTVLSRLLVAAGLLCTVCLAACTETAQAPQPLAQPLATAPTLAQAHHWYDSTARAAATATLPPLDWTHAQPSGPALVLPFQESAALFTHSPGQGFRFLLLAPTPHAGLTGTIVELLLPDKTLAPADAPALAQAAFAHFRQPASAQPLGQLTGRALFYSPAYHLLAGYAYQHGRATAQPTHLALTPRPSRARPSLRRAARRPPTTCLPAPPSSPTGTTASPASTSLPPTTTAAAKMMAAGAAARLLTAVRHIIPIPAGAAAEGGAGVVALVLLGALTMEAIVFNQHLLSLATPRRLIVVLGSLGR